MQRTPARSGFAIVAATVIMLVLVALATALSDITVSSAKQARVRAADVTLTVSAESVANLAFNHLQNLSDLDNELVRATTGEHDAELTDNVATMAGTNNGESTLNGVEQRATWKYLGSMTVPIMGAKESQQIFQITTTVAAGGPVSYYKSDGSTNRVQDIERYRRRRVEAMFIKFPMTAFRQAMFARNGFEYKGAATTDSWNSGGGAYATAPKGANGDLSSEGNIIVQKPENVQGDVNPYVHMPIPPLSYKVPGDAKSLPGYAKSPADTTLGVLEKTMNNVKLGTLGTRTSYHCTAISLSGDVEITPGAMVDIYVDGPMSIKRDWIIPMSPDPAKPTIVRIFQDDYDSSEGQTTINGNITVGCIDRPGSFQIYSLYDGKEPGVADQTPWDFKMNGNAKFGGTIFAPFMSLQLNGGADFFGSIIAESYRDNGDLGKVNGNFAFHYDEALGNIPLPFPPTLVVIGWRAFDLGLAEWRDAGHTVRWDDQ